MQEKMVPIYAENEKEKSGFTIFVDINNKRVFRASHKEINQVSYWIAFALVLALTRSISDIYLYQINIFFAFSLVVIGAFVSIYLGKIMHKKYISELREIYPTNDEIKSYIEDGKKILKREVTFILIFLVVATVFVVLFIIFRWLLWLVLSTLFFILVGIMLNSLVKDRFKVYKNGFTIN